MTLADKFIEQASPEVMYAQAGLSARDIAATALQALGLDAFPAQTAQICAPEIDQGNDRKELNDYGTFGIQGMPRRCMAGPLRWRRAR